MAFNLGYKSRSWSSTTTRPNLSSTSLESTSLPHHPNDQQPAFVPNNISPRQSPTTRQHSKQGHVRNISAKQLKFTYNNPDGLGSKNPTNANVSAHSSLPSRSGSLHGEMKQQQEEESRLTRCNDNALQCIYKLLLSSVKYWDDDWRARRGLEPYTHMLNFYLGILLLFWFVCGYLLTGLSMVGQYQCVGLDTYYTQEQCLVHQGIAVQYSLEGYVATHWIPFRVSTINATTGNTMVTNVTGVSGGWMFIDRFPMPPTHGQITHVPVGQSVFSNQVAFSEDQAFDYLDEHLGQTFPCLVPTSRSDGDSNSVLIEAKDRATTDCSTVGMYPYAWAIEDLLKAGTLRNQSTCNIDGNNIDVGRSSVGDIVYQHQLIVSNEAGRLTSTADEKFANAGDEFACSGRVIFLNATLTGSVQEVVDGFWLFFSAGLAFMSIWPLVCIFGRLHGWCWTSYYGYRVTGYMEDVINPMEPKTQHHTHRGKTSGLRKGHDQNTEKKGPTIEQRAIDAKYYNKLKKGSAQNQGGKGGKGGGGGGGGGGSGKEAGATGGSRQHEVEMTSIEELSAEDQKKEVNRSSRNSESSTFDTSRGSGSRGSGSLLDSKEEKKSTGEEKGKAAMKTEKAMKTGDLEEEPLDRRAQQLLVLKKSRKKNFVSKNTTDKTNPPRRQTSPPIQTKLSRRMAST